MQRSQPPGTSNTGPLPTAQAPATPLFSDDALADALDGVRRIRPDASLPTELLAFLRDNGEQLAKQRPFMNLAPTCWDDMTSRLQEILDDAQRDESDDACDEARDERTSCGALIEHDDGTLSLNEHALVFCEESHEGYGDLYFISLPRFEGDENGLSTQLPIDHTLFVIEADTVDFPHEVRINGPLTWAVFRAQYF